MGDFSKFKAFADDKLNVAKRMVSVCDWVVNIPGEGENVATSIFSFSQDVFKRLLSQGRSIVL